MYYSGEVMQQLSEQAYNSLDKTGPFFEGLLNEQSKEELSGLYLLGKEIRSSILESAVGATLPSDGATVDPESSNEGIKQKLDEIIKVLSGAKEEDDDDKSIKQRLDQIIKAISSAREEDVGDVEQRLDDIVTAISDVEKKVELNGTSVKDLSDGTTRDLSAIRDTIQDLPSIKTGVEFVKSTVVRTSQDIASYNEEVHSLKDRLQELILSANKAYSDAVSHAATVAGQSTSLSSAIRSFDDVLSSVTRYIDNLEQLRSYAEQMSLAAINSREAGEFIQKHLNEYTSWFSHLSSDMASVDQVLTTLCNNVSLSSQASTAVKEQLSEAVTQLKLALGATCSEIVSLTSKVASANEDQKQLVLRQQNISVAAAVLDNLTRVGCSVASSKQEELNRECQLEISKRRVFS